MTDTFKVKMSQIAVRIVLWAAVVGISLVTALALNSEWLKTVTSIIAVIGVLGFGFKLIDFEGDLDD